MNVSFFPYCTFSQYFAMILALVLVCTSTADCLCWLTANLNALIPFCSICFLRSLSAFSCWAYLAFLQASKHFCCISVCQKDTALCNRDEKIMLFPSFYGLIWVGIISVPWKLLAWNKVKCLHTSQVAYSARVHPGFLYMKRIGLFLFHLEGMLVHHRATPSITFGGTYLYTWVEKHCESVLPKKITQFPLARVQTQTAQFGDESTNYETTTPHQT